MYSYKKRGNEILFDNTIYYKISGITQEKHTIVEKDLNPDDFIAKNSSFLFLPSIINFSTEATYKHRIYVDFDYELLNSAEKVELFVKWIENNNGEGRLVELKLKISHDTKKIKS